MSSNGVEQRYRWAEDHLSLDAKERLILDNNNPTNIIKGNDGLIDRDSIPCDLSGYPELQGENLKDVLKREGLIAKNGLFVNDDQRVAPEAPSEYDQKVLQNMVAGKGGIPTAIDGESDSVRQIRLLIVLTSLCLCGILLCLLMLIVDRIV